MKDGRLLFVPLGGAGEIGMNFNLYGYAWEDEEAWIAVDVGVTFGDLHTPGVDLIMADTTFIEARREKLRAVVLTHGHEDHIGALAHLWPRLGCPVYATAFTASLLRRKLEEVGLHKTVPLHVLSLEAELELAPFKIEFITLTHSIPEPNALVVRVPTGVVFHTGDWKIDEAPVIGDQVNAEKIEAVGKEGICAMVCDSTNALVPGRSGSEESVQETLHEIISSRQGRVAVTSFASNVARLETVARIAAACGRKTALVGRSMRRMVEVAQENGLLKSLPPFLSEEEGVRLPREKILFLCTGSQGEPRAALMRIAHHSHPRVRLEQGDTVVFSSREIPGNEVAIAKVQNALCARGIEIITTRTHHVHVSGHPCRDELVDMYRWVRPRVAIPVHGEMRHMLAHEELARELQVPEVVLAPNGSVVQLTPEPAKIIDRVHHGRLYLDGQFLVAGGKDSSINHRRILSEVGAVFISLVLDDTGALSGMPQVHLVGVPHAPSASPKNQENASPNLEEIVLEAVEEAVSSIDEDWEDHDVSHRVYRAVRREIFRVWGKKPVTKIALTRL